MLPRLIRVNEQLPTPATDRALEVWHRDIDVSMGTQGTDSYMEIRPHKVDHAIWESDKDKHIKLMCYTRTGEGEDVHDELVPFTFSKLILGSTSVVNRRIHTALFRFLVQNPQYIPPMELQKKLHIVKAMEAVREAAAGGDDFEEEIVEEPVEEEVGVEVRVKQALEQGKLPVELVRKLHKALQDAQSRVDVEGSAPAEGSVPIEGSAPVEGSDPAEGSVPIEGSAPVEGSDPVEGSNSTTNATYGDELFQDSDVEAEEEDAFERQSEPKRVKTATLTAAPSTTVAISKEHREVAKTSDDKFLEVIKGKNTTSKMVTPTKAVDLKTRWPSVSKPKATKVFTRKTTVEPKKGTNKTSKKIVIPEKVRKSVRLAKYDEIIEPIAKRTRPKGTVKYKL